MRNVFVALPRFTTGDDCIGTISNGLAKRH